MEGEPPLKKFKSDEHVDIFDKDVRDGYTRMNLRQLWQVYKAFVSTIEILLEELLKFQAVNVSRFADPETWRILVDKQGFLKTHLAEVKVIRKELCTRLHLDETALEESVRKTLNDIHGN